MPQQRSRLLPGRALGELPIFQGYPRYLADWRDSLQMRAPSPQTPNTQLLGISTAWVNGQPPAWTLKIWLGLFLVGGLEIARVLLTIAISTLRN